MTNPIYLDVDGNGPTTRQVLLTSRAGYARRVWRFRNLRGPSDAHGMRPAAAGFSRPIVIGGARWFPIELTPGDARRERALAEGPVGSGAQGGEAAQAPGVSLGVKARQEGPAPNSGGHKSIAVRGGRRDTGSPGKRTPEGCARPGTRGCNTGARVPRGDRGTPGVNPKRGGPLGGPPSPGGPKECSQPKGAPPGGALGGKQTFSRRR